uniref:Uncharacterized protein n=1 Tax=Physcomitrium patens TaxID=3218 RepID=A9SF25_PHYPA|nr:hypothetical protein PHYPA_007112 [Physcomitrium patens]
MRFGKGTKNQQRREVGLRRKREEEEKKELCECTTRQRHRDRQTHSLSQSLHQRRLGKFPGREGKGGRESGPGEGGRAARQLLTSYVRMLGKWQQTDVSSSFALIQDPPPLPLRHGLWTQSLFPALPFAARPGPSLPAKDEGDARSSCVRIVVVVLLLLLIHPPRLMDTWWTEVEPNKYLNPDDSSNFPVHFTGIVSRRLHWVL